DLARAPGDGPDPEQQHDGPDRHARPDQRDESQHDTGGAEPDEHAAERRVLLTAARGQQRAAAVDEGEGAEPDRHGEDRHRPPPGARPPQGCRPPPPPPPERTPCPGPAAPTQQPWNLRSPPWSSRRCDQGRRSTGIALRSAKPLLRTPIHTTMARIAGTINQ